VRDPFSAQQRMFIEIVVEGLVQGTLTIGAGLDASLRAHRSPGALPTICKERRSGAALRSPRANAGAATGQRTADRTIGVNASSNKRLLELAIQSLLVRMYACGHHSPR
jgi:hypothetical protein